MARAIAKIGMSDPLLYRCSQLSELASKAFDKTRSLRRAKRFQHGGKVPKCITSISKM